ncbi:MAG: hypothetical protein ACP5I4_12385 [Oceanipulchritudo sp.]|jgi:hypothetical protein
MSQDHYSEFIGRKFVGLSIVLALVFWACFTRLLLPFVPAETPAMAYFFAGFTAICLTGVFFLASHMFQLVLQEHRKARRERNP